MQMSYAQNLEDYHLDLAFADQPVGVYVDVGGGHPVADNVTYWLYLKGWRGLVVEPQAKLADAYAHMRPGDVVYRGLAGAKDGEADFHAVEGLHGLSTMKPEMLAEAARFGAVARRETMPVRRLDGLVAEAGLGRVDLLKIDVEGAEAEVLAGLDLDRVRPRLLVIETLNPGNPDGTAGAWEAGLLAKGYDFQLFDRLNRFYVAREETGLKARLPREAASWDRVGHLWDHGRAIEKPASCDHALARVLAHGLFALAPSLPAGTLRALLEAGLPALGKEARGTSPETIGALLGTAEWPGPASAPADLEALLASPRLTAALARIACFYDGGHIVD